MNTIRLYKMALVTMVTCLVSVETHAQQTRLNVRYGDSARASVSRNRMNGEFRTEDGNSGRVQYRPGEIQGQYRGRDGSNATARITNNSGQFGYHDQRGDGISGGYSRQNGTTAVNGGYQTKDGYSYAGGADSRGNVRGSYARPGFLPGTTEKFSGEMSFQGRNSSVSGSHDLSVVGGPRVAGGNFSLNRSQYQQSQDARIGKVSGGQNVGVRFRGVNSEVTGGQNVNIAGGARANVTGKASINAVNGQGKIGVAGTNIGISANLNRDGGHLRVSPPKITVPTVSTPKVSMPKISAPKVSVPKVKMPKLGF